MSHPITPNTPEAARRRVAWHNRHLAYRLYQGAILRLGEDVAYPVWLGSSQLFKNTVPASFGVTEEYYEGVAQNHWPAEGERP